MNDAIETSGAEFFGFGKDLTDSGVHLRLKVRGQSMFPFVQDGDVVEIVPLPYDQVRVGDIVFFRSGTRLLAHRVVSRAGEGQALCLVTRGDNLGQLDQPLELESDLMGRVDVIYRNGREIRLDRGFRSGMGRLVARNEPVRHAIHWSARLWRFCRRQVGQALPRSMAKPSA